MKMKKLAALMTAGLMSVSILVSCVASHLDASAAQTGASVTAKDTEQTEVYRTAYAEKLAELRAEYGTPHKNYSREPGLTFADLLDWDGDGTPELLTFMCEGTDNDAVKCRFAVWGERDGAAVSLLDTAVGSSYGNPGSVLYVCVMRSSDGALTLRVEDSHNFADRKETYYTLSGGTVRSTVLTAQSSVGGWIGEGDNTTPIEPDAYQIDGAECDKAALDAKRSALGSEEAVSVFCRQAYDLDALDAFLTAQTDVYAGGALPEAAAQMCPQPQWLQEALFTVGA